MNNALRSLIEASQRAHMPKEEREAQRRSFAYGNTHFENPLITRDMIDRAAERLSSGQDDLEVVAAAVHQRPAGDNDGNKGR